MSEISNQLIKIKQMSPEQEERAIREWDVIFKSPQEARKYESMAKQLIASGKGKKKVKGKNGKMRDETDLEYMLRVQYCVTMDIPLCLLNKTYPLDGSFGQMVEIKLWKFQNAYPLGTIEFVMSGNGKMIKQGRISPNHNWFRVEWTIEKAKKLKYYHEKKAHWVYNEVTMLSNRCDGQICDVLGGSTIRGSGYMSPEELNALGIDVESVDDE